MKQNEAKISCELIAAAGPNGEDTKAQVHIEGSPNALLNAFQHLTEELFGTFIERMGKEDAMALYSIVQLKVLEKLDKVGLERAKKEAVGETSEEEVNRKRRDALLSILGKTFKMPEKEEAE